MSARNYDFVLTVANTNNFVASNLVIGLSSQTTGLIVNVDSTASTIRVKLANVNQEFIVGERLISNASIFKSDNVFVTYSNSNTVSVVGNNYTLNGTTNSFSLPSSNLTNFYTDSIDVYFNGFLMPKQSWVYPAISAIGSYGITIKPLVFTKTVQTETENLKYKASEVLKQNYFNPQNWRPGSSVVDITQTPSYSSSIVQNYNKIIPDTDLSGMFVGSTTEVTNQTQFSHRLPTANTANIVIKLSYGLQTGAPFFPGYKSSEVETANTTISAINPSGFIAVKNAFQQQPVVRLYTLYYPGEWYPPRTSGNPNSEENDIQYPWPKNFPFRFAEVRGDYISDITYRIQFGGVEYLPYPINSTGISLDSSGKINDVSLIVSNFDSLVTSLVEDAYLCGYNNANSSYATVNGELVYNIDPRTNPANVHYSSSYAELHGVNTAWSYGTTTAAGNSWIPLKQDTRDLLGGIIEIKTTFANLLDYWPEYSSIIEKANGNYLKMRTTSPYRVGDIVHSNSNNMSAASAVILQLVHPYLVVNNAIHLNPGDNLYIKNADASSEEYVLDTFKINSLEGLDETSAKFSLTSWLQYFKNTLPRRRFLKNACVWPYKGDECQYPVTGSGTIPGSTKSANGYFTINNLTTTDATQDSCPKNLIACRLRNNEIHYSSFPGTGTAVQR
jgi:phage-related protein